VRAAHIERRRSRARAYADRRRWLEQCLFPSPHVQLVHAEEDGEELYKAALASGFEGVIAKRKDSKYEAGKRSPAWLKIKPTRSAEFVVGGVTRERVRARSSAPCSSATGTRASCATADTSARGSTIARSPSEGALREAANRRLPFAEKPELHSPTTWVSPSSSRKWSSSNGPRTGCFALRCSSGCARTSTRNRCAGTEPRAAARPTAEAAARFPDTEIDAVLGQLDNKKPCPHHRSGAAHAQLTHLDRVYWPADAALKQPAITKRDLLRYFAQVSPFMLTHLADRPLTMIRMPEGIAGERFFQKHWDPELPAFAKKITIFPSTRTSGTTTSCATTSRRCCGSRSRGRSNSTCGTRAPSPDPTRSRNARISRARSPRSRARSSTIRLRRFRHRSYIYSGKEAPGTSPS